MLFRKKQASHRHLAETTFLDRFPTNSRFAEAYRSLRTNINFSFMEGDFRILLVTSAAEQEGKTSTVYNIGYTMAKAEKSVLIIDADLRKPLLSSQVTKARHVGISGLLSGVFGTPLQTGPLAEMRLGDLRWLLALQKKSGRLRLRQGEEVVEILFQQGEMVDLAWVTRPADQRLARVLIDTGVITGEQAKQALLHQRSMAQRLGAVLIATGVLSKEQLTGALTMHMMEALRLAVNFKEGTFEFRAMPEGDIGAPSFNPVDFNAVYRQVIVGEEEMPFLERQIEAALVPTGVANMRLLPAGKLPPNPSELLGSRRISFLLQLLKRRFDRLIIDTPPLLPASDALLLAPQADGVVLVVKTGAVNRKMVRKVVDQLWMVKARLIGVALNQVDVRREGYYRYYHKYYTSYYGKEE